jgi:outer membrane protein
MLRPLALLPFLLVLPAVTFAQAPDPASAPPLTLDACIARALDQNFTLQLQRFATPIAREELTLARAAYDPILAATVATSQSRSPLSPAFDNNGIILNTGGTTSEAVTSDLSLSQKIVTGAVVTGRSSLDSNQRTPTASALNPAYTSDVSLSVRQPLLKGFGPAYNRTPTTRARLSVTRTAADLQAAVLTVVRDVESAYYTLAFTREQLAVRTFSLAVAQKLLEENQIRRTTGVATDLDVLQAEVGVANSRRDLLLAEQASADRADALLNLIGPFDLTSSLGAVTLGADPTDAVSFDHSYALARAHQPEHASTQALIDQLQLDATTARRDRQPSLSLGAGVGYSARQDSYRNASRELWSGDGYSWQADLTLNFPWGLHAETARYRQARASLSREQLRLLQLDQTLLVQVRAALRAVETSQANVTLSLASTTLSEKQFSAEKARYDAGLSTFRRVQEAQADLDTARVNALQARVNLRLARAELARLEASSLAHYRITLGE